MPPSIIVIDHCLYTLSSLTCPFDAFLHHFLSSTVIEVSLSKSHDSCESLTESDCAQCPCFTRPIFRVLITFLCAFTVYSALKEVLARPVAGRSSSISRTFPFKYLDFLFSPKILRHSAKLVTAVAGERTAAPSCLLGSVAIGFEHCGICDFSQISTKLFEIITYFSDETFRMALKRRFHVIYCRKVSNLFLRQAALIVM